jgi:hypothetical protein
MAEVGRGQLHLNSALCYLVWGIKKPRPKPGFYLVKCKVMIYITLPIPLPMG